MHRETKKEKKMQNKQDKRPVIIEDEEIKKSKKRGVIKGDE